MTFSKDSIKIDPAVETNRIVTELRKTMRKLRRFGGVVGVSGGIDSAVALGLAVKAFGPDKVVAIMMPEHDSNPISEQLARELCARYGVTAIKEDLTAALAGAGCYQRRDEAMKRVFPEYDPAKGYKSKIVIPNDLLEAGTLNVFNLTIITPDGKTLTKPLAAPEFLQIVAASNFKQRTRMMMVYFHAEARNYAVIGTANKNEHDQGFFVKYGDGGVDIKTIGHLYKTQVYQLAEYLNVTNGIRERTPTTDTYSAPQDQQEFFYRLPFETMDLLWYAEEHNVSPAEAAKVMGLTEQQVARAYEDFKRKRAGTEYLRLAPVDLV
jgi:NAD+ synthase